ncbi:hypothetical protein [Thalassospira lucentensis]|uniref:hypothetical protein n=1 Tax=Thalassospira lucentensis TaxID=168935 RepID=UPI003AA93FA3
MIDVCSEMGLPRTGHDPVVYYCLAGAAEIDHGSHIRQLCDRSGSFAGKQLSSPHRTPHVMQLNKLISQNIECFYTLKRGVQRPTLGQFQCFFLAKSDTVPRSPSFQTDAEIAKHPFVFERKQ